MFGKLRSLFGGERKGVMDITALIDAGARTAAGISVNPDLAMKCAPVYAGTRVIAETIGSLPLHLYKRRTDGGKDRAADHPLYKLLHDRPNGWTAAPEFIMALQKDCVTHGRGLAYANRAGDKIVELIRLPPASTAVEEDPKSLEPVYKVTLKAGGVQTYRWQDILHVSALGGLSPIKQASEAIGVYMAMEAHAAKLFGSGARPAGVLTFANKLSEVAFNRLKQSSLVIGGPSNSGGTAILEEGGKFEALTFNSVDLQFQELRTFQLLEIARVLRVPPTLLQDFGRATWGNATEMSQNFLTFTIMPWLKLWHGAIARLMPADEQAEYFPEFLVDDLVKADIAARFTAYTQAVNSRIIFPNEIRAMENRAPYQGGDEWPQTIAPVPAPPAERPKPKAVA
jgi:HK97 family phage portal protein